jgi:hypothetical protein
MSFPVKSLSAAALLLAASAGIAHANDASDVARVAKLPVPVVENVLTNVDAYFASNDAPSNRMTSGILKDLVLKTVKSRLGNLDDAAPGKASDATVEDKNASYRAVVRTSRHDTSEASDCVENKVTLTSSEGQPVVKDGAFIFDMVHPHVSNWSWSLTFCRTPTSNGEFSDWQLAQ